MELREHRPLLLGRNAEPRVPDLDARRARNAAAADQHPALDRILERVRNEVLQQAPHQPPVGANGEPRRHEFELKPLRPGDGRELDFEHPHQIGDGHVRDFRPRRAGVEPRNVEKRA